MNIGMQCVWSLLGFLSGTLSPTQTVVPPLPIVRVLIDETSGTDSKRWELTSTSGFLLYEPDKSSRSWHSKQTDLSIQFHHDHLYLNEKLCPTGHLHIVPLDGYATIHDQPYRGSFSIVLYEQRALLINHVDLEEYVHAVLRTESWPGWPVEVNKAFAIVSRSYVIAMMYQAQTNPGAHPLPYHIKNTNEHQTYKGMHEVRTIGEAIKQTQGMFLTYNNKPALTMFDSCCGGIIPANIADFDFEKAPYLKRSYACTHCARCRIYTWKTTMSWKDFTAHITHLIPSHISIDSVTITNCDPAGLVSDIAVRCKDKVYHVTGKQFYAAFKAVKSFCFSITKLKEEVTIEGKGFGHHLGLCQWGAREMVRDGWHYKRILSFYYPDLRLSRLQ